MDTTDGKDVGALLLGTWIGIAIIADLFVRGGILRRGDFTTPLADATEMAKDDRGIALAALLRLIDRGFAEAEAASPRTRRKANRRRGEAATEAAE